MGKFSGKVAIVTGATSGIGKTTALAFAHEGAKVVLAGRREKQGTELAAAIKSNGGEALFVPTDVAQEAQVKKMVETALKTYGRLDAAFNNAGTEGLRFVLTHEQTVANFRDVMDTNVLGTLLCMKYELPALLKSRGGAIVNCASVTGLVGVAGMGVYAASKHAILGLTKTVALEYARLNVRINAVAPGVIESEMFDRFAAEGSVREKMDEMHPLGRIGKPEEIASTVLYLCSPEASFITGTNLAIDGGWTAQ